jgi:hypothetical protein
VLAFKGMHVSYEQECIEFIGLLLEMIRRDVTLICVAELFVYNFG